MIKYKTGLPILWKQNSPKIDQHAVMFLPAMPYTQKKCNELLSRIADESKDCVGIHQRVETTDNCLGLANEKHITNSE